MLMTSSISLFSNCDYEIRTNQNARVILFEYNIRNGKSEAEEAGGKGAYPLSLLDRALDSSPVFATGLKMF